MKMKSGRIRNEIVSFELDTTVQQFWIAKGRKGGILEHVVSAIYNTSQSSATALYFLFKSKGVIRRFLYDATLETLTLRNYLDDLYLDDGDEFGIEMDGGTQGDTIEVFSQWLWHVDGDV